MRIISGRHKGKRLIAPKRLPVRPTTDFAKEGLFNILRNNFDFEDLRVLDLFAGTGNISYEFASRGSTDITAVDANFGCVKFIKQTSDDLDMNINTVKSDALKFLKSNHTPFDIIFCDPPYNFETKELNDIVEAIFSNELLNEEGLLIIEHGKHTDCSALPHFTEARRYGSSVFSFFEIGK